MDAEGPTNMCVIVTLQPYNDTNNNDISKTTLRQCWDANPHGAGMAYFHNNKLVVQKGFMRFRNFYKQFRIARKQAPRVVFTVHFRKASVGRIGPNQTHPFWVEQDKSAIFYNGTIKHFDLKKGGLVTDTEKFAELLRLLPHKWYTNDYLNELISSFTQYHPWVLHTTKTQYTYWSSCGIEIDGAWYSNTKWKPYSNTNTNLVPSGELTCPCGRTLVTPQEIVDGWCYFCKFASQDVRNKRCAICGAPIYLDSEIKSHMCATCMIRFQSTESTEGVFTD